MKRHKFALKKQEKLFVNLKQFLLNKGALPVVNGFYEFCLMTNVGPLFLSFSTGHEIATVFCRFDDVQKAKTATDCNPYSGKWNFHINKDGNPDYFKSEIDRIMNQPGKKEQK